MPIKVACTSCRKGYAVDEKLAGKRVKCPACGAPIAVPSDGMGTVAQPPVQRASGTSSQGGAAVATKPPVIAAAPNAAKVTCGQCRQEYQLAPQLVGKRIKCKKCGGVIDTGPPPPPVAAEPSFSLLDELDPLLASAGPVGPPTAGAGPLEPLPGGYMPAAGSTTLPPLARGTKSSGKKKKKRKSLARGQHGGMMRWGIGLIVFGIGAVVLPLAGLQWKLLYLVFGDFSWIPGLILLLVGVVLLVLSFFMSD